MNDILSRLDIVVFVDAFYAEVKKDVLIGPVFAAAIPQDAWPMHLNRMYGFWNTVLFRQREYSGSPFSKHADLPIEQRHFDRWLSLLTQVLDLHFKGEKAEEVKWRADKMGQLFSSKLRYIRENPDKTQLV